MSEPSGRRTGLASLLPAGLHFRLRRLGYLLGRGLLSLRTRGLAGTLQRVGREFQRVDADARADLVFPASDAGTMPRFEACADPVASIVIPVYGQLAMTLDCLHALAAQSGDTPMEVIVVDDASPDDSARVLSSIEGLHLVALPDNRGFIGACNAGAAVARGRFLVFLNNDTVVQPGWLDALLGTFDAFPDTGLAGALLVYPDGRLQEAGSLVYRDGSCWSIGRFESPLDPRYRFVREVDYCSGAALGLRTALFRQLAGFDTRFAPAYYEDTDLAMQVRQAGLKVRVQPAAVVVHREGGTCGVDALQGPKAAQLANQCTFQVKWRDALEAGHASPGSDPIRADRRRSRGRVLVIDVQVPRPDRDSGSLRMTHLLRLLVEAGFAVDFLPDSRERDGDYAAALEQMGVCVWSRDWLGSLPRWFRQHGAHLDLVIASRHYVAATYLPLLRRHAPQAKLVFDTVDLHFLREEREAQFGRGSAAIARRTREQELALIDACDATLVVSTHERDLLAEAAPGARVEVLSNIHTVAGGGLPFESRSDVVFVGGFRHPPNVDAALWMARDIWPRVRRHLPDAVLHLVGGDACADVAGLDGIDGVRVRGYLPDIDPLMDGCRVAVAPLRYGAGVKGKVNLSMAHGQPVVATSCAVEGMHLADGHDVLVADTPEDFAAAVVRAYTDPALWSRLSQGGLANVEAHFSVAAARRSLHRLVDELLSPAGTA